MRFTPKRYFILFPLFLLLFAQYTFGQSTSEEDVKKQAQKYFDAGDFTSALPLYSQLLSFYAKDPNYNYRYGVCALEAGNDREKPIAYLEFASKNKDINNNVFFYLGKAYHLNYRFASALNAYNTFKIKALKIDQDKFQVDRQLEMCRNGMELLKNISDLTVMEKKELALTDYFRAYDLTSIGLKLLVKPDDFKTDLDKKKNEESVVVLNPNKSEIYFSSYGNTEKYGKDIYKVKRMDNGDWTNPIRLDNTINTEFDEDYPFLSNDGTTLYFCSKGHNSMGGFDVFKSTYNSAAGTWSAPENMDFAVNTPDDDILYIADDVNKVAYFSSRRTSGQGNINVYKIKVGPRPPSIALISGVFSTTDENTHPEATITVRDNQNKSIIGVYKSDPKTGNYSIPLPSSGKYIFNIESETTAMKTETVDVPEKKDLGTLQQKISVQNDKLSITNIFDDVAINEANLQALLKAKANLDVNYIAEVKTAPVEEPKTNNLSNQDLVNIAYQDAKDTQAEADQLKLKSDQAYAVSKSKMDVSKGKLNTAEVMEKNAQALSSAQQKSVEMDKVNQLKREAKMTTLQAYAVYTIAKNLEEDAKIKQAEADQSMNYAKELDNAIQINSKESIERLTAQKNALPETNTPKNISETATSDLMEQAENKQQEADAALSRAKIILTDMLDIDLKTETLTKDKSATSDEKTIQDLTAQLSELKTQKAEKQKLLDQENSTASQMQQEADDLKSQSEFIASAMNDLKSGTNTLPAPSPQEKITLGNELAIDLGRANTVAKAEPVLQANNSDINDNAADAFITTDIGKSPVTAANFNAKMVQANKISDPVKREEQKNVIRKQMNENWEKDIVDLKTQQANSKDKNVRADMQMRITELENLKAMNTPTPEVALTTAAEVKQNVAQTSTTPVATDSSALAVNSTKTSGTTTSNPSSTDGTSAGANGATNTAPANTSNSTTAQTDNANTVTTAPEKGLETTVNGSQGTASTSNPAVTNDSTSKSALAVNPTKVDDSETTANTTTVAEGTPVATSQAEPLAAVNVDKLEEDYDQQLNMVNQIVDANEKANANQKLAQSWGKVTDEKIATTQNQLTKATNSEDIANLNEKIKDLQTLKAKIISSVPEASLAVNSGNAAVSSPESASTSKVETAPVTGGMASASETSNTVSTPVSGTNETETKATIAANFTSEQALVQAKKADRLNLEALQLKSKEDSLAQVLSVTNDSLEKNKIKDALIAVRKDGTVKRIDVLKAYSVANNVEFNGYSDQLKTVSENKKGLDSDNSSRAEMLVAEAAYYYNEATIKSELNKSVTDINVKEEELKKIVDFEKTAIEKQRRALATYGAPVGLASAGKTPSTTSTSQNPELASTASPTQTNGNTATTDETSIEKPTATTSAQESKSTTAAQPSTPVNTNTETAAAPNSGNANQIGTTEQKDNSTVANSGTNNTTATPIAENKSNGGIANSSTAAKTTTNPNSIAAKIEQENRTKAPIDNTPVDQRAVDSLVARNAPAAQEVEEREQAFVYPTDTIKTTVVLAPQAMDSIISSPYYNYYNSLLVEATANLQQSEFYKTRGEKLKKQAVNDSLAAEVYIFQASQSKDSLRMQELISKAALSTYNSTQNKEHSDSSFSVSRRLKNAASDNREFAARYVSRLSERDKNNLAIVMNTTKKSGAGGAVLASSRPKKVPVKKADENTPMPIVNKEATINSDSLQALLKLKISIAKDLQSDSVQQVMAAKQMQLDIEEARSAEAALKSKESGNTTVASNQNEPAETQKTISSPSQLATNNSDLAVSTKPAKTNNAVLANVVNENNELVKEAVFSKVNASKYSKSNPIPINAALPTGIIFKVQIGAFRNPIPQDLFKGFDPINGETSASGVTRYTAGYFKNIEAANSAKREINGIGYKDAFVVAFCNGKRISIAEATAMIRDGRNCGPEQLAENKLNFTSPAKTEEVKVTAPSALAEQKVTEVKEAETKQDEAKIAEQKVTETPVAENKPVEVIAAPVKESASSQQTTTPAIEEPSPSGPVAPSVSFEEVRGLVYTVQVGVYSKRILANQLFNIQPLYYERTANGLYRYTSGIYDNLETATQAKASIVGIGVKDAFVTTYFNGARIPVDQAKKLEQEQGKAVFAVSNNLNKMPEINANARITGLNAAVPTVRIEKNSGTEESGKNKIVLPVEGLKNQVKNDILFKVQIGVFRSEVPLEIAAIYLKLSYRGINHYQTSDSLNIYTIGNLRDINSANSLKDEVIQEGLPDVFVVAFKGGVKMKLEEAIKESSNK